MLGQRWYQERYKEIEVEKKDFLGLGVTSRFVETGPISTTRLKRNRGQSSVLKLPGSFYQDPFLLPLRVATHGKQVAST